jgi:hypothetical protein
MFNVEMAESTKLWLHKCIMNQDFVKYDLFNKKMSQLMSGKPH